jgi:hypothetical protein
MVICPDGAETPEDNNLFSLSLSLRPSLQEFSLSIPPSPVTPPTTGKRPWPTRTSSQKIPPPLIPNLVIPQSLPTRSQRQSNQGLAHHLSTSPIPYISHQRAAPRKNRTNMVFPSQCLHLLSLCLSRSSSIIICIITDDTHTLTVPTPTSLFCSSPF